MTTIVFDGKELVSDSRMTCDGHIESDVQKVFELKDGSLYAGAGTYEEILEVLEWIEDGSPRGRPKLEDFEGIHVKQDGSVFTCQSKLRWWRTAKPIAIGSGAKYARAGMECGLSGRKSVELAAKFDTGTGGALQILKLNTSKVRAVS